ncbi:MmpS family transport accessory protein [Streptomyces qinglanensis]|uniref:Membrane protein n=1 Tax=Streptomyces qinglanensis TaxID=943816 RepID=A0A1H9U3C2_9ACTN|nr:MmpS family transport accessory protein [Streptomyces qinglanensis]SES03728.1 membrane protein [Streptomyces qinglanensis]
MNPHQQYPGQPQPPFQQQWQPQPPPKKKRTGLIVLSVIGGVLVLGGIGSAIGGGDTDKKDTASEPSAKPKPEKENAEPAGDEAPKAEETSAKPKPAAKPEPKPKPKTVTIKVWGSAPAGADITYGTDTDSRQGSGLPMTKTLPFNDDALWYHVNAQLQGGGDINCSVTVNGETKKAHASGGYNICNAQLSNTGLGWH